MAATSPKAGELQGALELSNRQPGEVLLLPDSTESRHVSERRQRQERLGAIGEMTARFAHQVRTPLASAMLYTAQLDRSSPKQQRVAQKITERLNDLGRMVNDMLGFAAGAKRPQEEIRVNELLTDAQLALEAQIPADVEFRVLATDADTQIAANRDELRGALLNLVNNALQACTGAAEIVLTAGREADTVVLSVSDNGPGIRDEILPKLFEPFFTTRPQGTGLGLPVVRAVARAHGGEVNVATSARGTCFTLRIPALSATRETVQ